MDKREKIMRKIDGPHARRRVVHTGRAKKNCDINGKNSRKINNGSDYRLTQHHPSIHQVNNFVKRYLFLV